MIFQMFPICQVVLFHYWIFHNRSSKIIGQEVRLMIDYNRKLSNERECRFDPQECLSLYRDQACPEF